ncbi:tRNA (adenosine(37)-N6)-dimethylallyltransferase MiaA [Pelagibacteraceae bacterium]|nr:tRNA (adenosine(37)-N6)-dimethylallyltransferase MiaA [Pelagibacteraceae bacterium]
MSKKIILLAGPTASGKSKLAIEIANKIDGEIINADSMQVYRDFSALSSRPSKVDLKKIKHHLYGFISSKKYFSTGAWLSLAKEKIKLCLNKKKIPILVGGTGLYFEAITKGMSKIPNIDFKKRNKIRDLQFKLGQKEFYKKLLELDPLVKNKIEPLDMQRSIRAYEVKKFTKRSIYEWYKLTKSDFKEFEIYKIFLNSPREKILKNISKRTKEMIKNNCINEVKDFLKLKIDPALSVNKIIGVKEIKDYLDQKIDLNQVIELINIKTRQYAKRQVTWSRGHMIDWKREYSNSFRELSKNILKLLS